MAAHLTFMIKTEKSMLKYEIVSILRNKAAYIFLLVVLLFGLKATVELQRSITSSQDTNYIKRELQYELVMHRQLLYKCNTIS